MMDFCYIFEKKVKAYIRAQSLAQSGEHLLVGVSGGADSLCLLELLWRFSKEWQWKLTAVHIHHGIRGDDADEDERFVQAYCQDRNIVCVCRHYDVPSEAKRLQEGEEAAARRLRYQAFEEIRMALGADKIALAHHRDDQAETMLFHLIRGSNLKGLGGMLPCNGRKIRPLLSVSKEEICRYLKEAGIVWRTDQSNFSEVYARNYLRQKVLPLLCQVNAGAVSNISRAARQISETEAYLRKQTKQAEEKLSLPSEKENPPFIYIRKDLYEREEALIRKRILYDMLCVLTKSQKDVNECHVEAMERLFTKQSGKRIELPYGIQARRDSDGVWLENKCVVQTELAEISLFAEHKKKGFAEFSQKEQISGKKLLPPWGMILEWRLFFPEKNARIPKNSYTKWFDYDKISSTALFRTRRAGDWFVLDHTGGHKKLKQYFIDEKIPSQQRNTMLLLADGSHIIWIVGKRISEEYKVRKTTGMVLELRLRLEEKRQEAK